MSNEWKDKVIRGGTIAMGAVAAVVCMTVIIGLAVGSPGSLRTSVIMLAAVAGIGLVSVLAVSFPSRQSGSRRRQQDQHCP